MNQDRSGDLFWGADDLELSLDSEAASERANRDVSEKSDAVGNVGSAISQGKGPFSPHWRRRALCAMPMAMVQTA